MMIIIILYSREHSSWAIVPFFRCKIFICDWISLKFCTFIQHMELRRLMLSDLKYLNRFKSYQGLKKQFWGLKIGGWIIVSDRITFEPIEISKIWKYQSTQLHALNKYAKFQRNRITNKQFIAKRTVLGLKKQKFRKFPLFPLWNFY